MPVKNILVGFMGLMVVVTGLVFVVSKPKVETGETSADVGEIKISDAVTRDFEIKNTGEKPLQITNINSSCGCTSGKIIYKGFTSKEYSMHTQSGFVTEISPSDTAILQVTYRPASMPVYGSVQREVYVSTNDPDKSRLVFGIRAIVR